MSDISSAPPTPCHHPVTTPGDPTHLSSHVAWLLACKAPHIPVTLGWGIDTASQPSIPQAYVAGTEHEEVSPSFAFAGNKKLTRWAQFQDGYMVDIYNDAATLNYLRTRRLASTATRVMSKRVNQNVLRRA